MAKSAKPAGPVLPPGPECGECGAVECGTAHVLVCCEACMQLALPLPWHRTRPGGTRAAREVSPGPLSHSRSGSQ
jgi:hypothetical protein